LKERKATDKVINKFIKNTNRVKIPFSEILEAVKSREGRLWNVKKSQMIATNAAGALALAEE